MKGTAIWQNLHEKLNADGRRTDVLHQLTRGNDGTSRKKYFVLRRWKRNYWGCLPRGGLVAVVLTNRIFRATVSTVHNVLFAQFEFLPTNPTLANICQKKHILTNRIFRARVSTVVKMCRQYKVVCLSFSR